MNIILLLHNYKEFYEEMQKIPQRLLYYMHVYLVLGNRLNFLKTGVFLLKIPMKLA